MWHREELVEGNGKRRALVGDSKVEILLPFQSPAVKFNACRPSWAHTLFSSSEVLKHLRARDNSTTFNFPGNRLLLNRCLSPGRDS